MKAVICTKYGPPEVLKLEEIPTPTAGDDEVLVKIYAASVNPHDWRSMRADPFLVRLMGAGFLKPKHKVIRIKISSHTPHVIEVSY